MDKYYFLVKCIITAQHFLYLCFFVVFNFLIWLQVTQGMGANSCHFAHQSEMGWGLGSGLPLEAGRSSQSWVHANTMKTYGSCCLRGWGRSGRCALCGFLQNLRVVFSRFAHKAIELGWQSVVWWLQKNQQLHFLGWILGFFESFIALKTNNFTRVRKHRLQANFVQDKACVSSLKR